METTPLYFDPLQFVIEEIHADEELFKMASGEIPIRNLALPLALFTQAAQIVLEERVQLLETA